MVLFSMTKGKIPNDMPPKGRPDYENGTMFGSDGSDFQRINITCPRTTLEQALQKLETAVIKRSPISK